MELKKTLERMRVEDLVPYENNPRNIPQEAIDAVCESYRQCGVIDPIEVDEHNVILSGHTRLYAAQEMAIKEVDVLVVHGLNEKQKRKYRILANKTGEFTTWDYSLLEKELEDLDFDGYDFGFEVDFEALGADPNEVVEDDYDPEPPPDPISKSGDVWQLGDHRLLVGDSTNADDVKLLMDGEQADLWLTDPPYNVDYTAKEKDLLKYRPNKRVEQGQHTGIANDKMESGAFLAFLMSAFIAAKEAMRPGAVFYIWHADSESVNFRTACSEVGLPVRETLIWVKNHFVLGHLDYQYKHEPCLYGWKDGEKHYFTNSRGETTVIQDLTEIDPKKMKKEELVELLTKMLSDKATTTVLNFDKPTRSEGHPTMKPVALFDYCIRNSTKKGQIVLDTFAGSGTTIMAAKQSDAKRQYKRSRCDARNGPR